MIFDIKEFVSREKVFWEELEKNLKLLEETPKPNLTIEAITRFHYLYERVSTNLLEVRSFTHEKDLNTYLEDLVARSYMQIFEMKKKKNRFKPFSWFLTSFPVTFRRQVKCFWISTTIMMIGCLMGAGIIAFDPPSKKVIFPAQFSHLLDSPSDRVAREESITQSGDNNVTHHRAAFSAQLMTHNTKVSITTMALGLSWGFGTVILLFYNGVILGGVAMDYIFDGQLEFLLGWLLPHGSVEIPAILIAGQAGLVIAFQMLKRNSNERLGVRLKKIMPDVCFLICGVAVMLVWAGFIESFFSQYHEPVLPYWLKIFFGFIELIGLFLFLFLAGRKSERNL